jgi:hypothetical protein
MLTLATPRSAAIRTPKMGLSGPKMSKGFLFQVRFAIKLFGLFVWFVEIEIRYLTLYVRK